MVDVLANLRDTLGNTARQAWEGEEDARQALESTLEGNSDDIEACFDAADTQACLERIFEDNNLGSGIEQDWDGGDFADIITSLRDVQMDWSPDARNAVREIAANNDLSQLHRWCTTGQVDRVRDEIDTGNFSEQLNAEYGFASPSTGRQCLQAVALIQDVRTDLREAWETAM